MPFNVGESINQIAEAFLRAPVVTTVMTNPIYTALLLVFAIVLVIMFIFRSVDTGDDQSLLSLCMRGGVWIFMLLLGTLFLHDHVLAAEVSDKNKSGDYEAVFSGGFIAANRGEGFSDVIVPVEVNTDFTRGPSIKN